MGYRLLEGILTVYASGGIPFRRGKDWLFYFALPPLASKQGAGAGAIQPIAITIVGDIYRPTERARVQGYISGVFGVAAIIGPMPGAFLVEHVTWSLVFWINLPIGAVTFLMLGLFLHEGQVPRRHRIDYLGSALMMFGAGALMLTLVQVGNSGEIATIAALASSGVVAPLALAAHERGAAEPILPLKLWRDRVIAVGSLAVFSLSWHLHCRRGSARRVRSHGFENILYPEIARRSL
jgi:MFS family permease